MISFNAWLKNEPPSDGIRVAMIRHNGAPIELIEFDRNKILDLYRQYRGASADKPNELFNALENSH